MNKSESLKELATALSKAQGSFRPAEFDSVNPHFKSKYASLASVMAACRVPLAENGLSIVQRVSYANETRSLETMLLHSSGEWISSDTPLLLGNRVDMQSLGSAITYAKRYAVAAMLGIVADADDDGEGSMERPGAGVKSASLHNVLSPKGAPAKTAGPKMVAPNVDSPAVCPPNAKFPTLVGMKAEDMSMDELIDLRTFAEDYFAVNPTPPAWAAFLKTIPAAMNELQTYVANEMGNT